MNTAIFSGHITKDCRTGATPSGTAVANFTLAVNSGYGDNEHTDYVECALFGKRAEGKLPQYLVKGQSVTIAGDVQLKQREQGGQKGSPPVYFLALEEGCLRSVTPWQPR